MIGRHSGRHTGDQEPPLPKNSCDVREMTRRRSFDQRGIIIDHPLYSIDEKYYMLSVGLFLHEIVGRFLQDL